MCKIFKQRRTKEEATEKKFFSPILETIALVNCICRCRNVFNDSLECSR